MITSLALVTLLWRAVGTGLTSIIAQMTPIDLPDAPRQTGVVGLGCREADKTPAVRPVPYLRILGSYASYATPTTHRRSRHHSRGSMRRPGASLQGKKRMAGASPAISLMHKGIGRARLLPLDLHHLIGLGAARRDDLDLRAFLLAD